MLHPTIAVPKVGDMVRAKNVDTNRTQNIVVLTEMLTLPESFDDWYTCIGKDSDNCLVVLNYYYNPEDGYDVPLALGAGSEDNYDYDEWLTLSKVFGMKAAHLQ